MATEDLLPAHVLRQLLRYEPETGKLFWLARSGDTRGERYFNTRYSGKEALTGGCKGYRVGSIGNAAVKAHRVAWAIYYGEWPQGFIDHINGDRADNRITNLRVVDHAGNGRNRRPGANNRSGVLGVGWNKRHKKWRASIRHNGELIYLGAFEAKEDAVAARLEAEKRYGFSAGRTD